jgi:aldehyde dehydrogenase (NAD+)
MEIREGVFVDGTWRPSTGEATVTVINPYTEEPFGHATLGTAEDVDTAVRSAHRAGTEPVWRNSSLEDRIALVEAIRDALIARAEELARLASSSMGSPFLTAKGLGMSAELIDM